VWEAVASTLAQKGGIAVPESRVELIAKKPVLLLQRVLTGEGARRIPFHFLVFMSMLGSKDNETRSYLEIVDAPAPARGLLRNRHERAMAREWYSIS